MTPEMKEHYCPICGKEVKEPKFGNAGPAGPGSGLSAGLYRRNPGCFFVSRDGGATRNARR